MFIFLGKKLVFRKKGYVADYCLVCRAVQPFQLIRLGLAGHIYFISVSEGMLISYEMTCQCCKAIYETGIERYKKIERKNASVQELIQSTNPNVNFVYQDHLIFNEQLRFNSNFLSSEERGHFIQHTLAALHLKLAKQFERRNLDRHTLISIPVAILGCMMAITYIIPLLNNSDIAEPLSLLLLAFEFGCILWVGIGARARYIRRGITPVIYKALYIIKPTDDELLKALENLKNLDYIYMKKIKPKELIGAFK